MDREEFWFLSDVDEAYDILLDYVEGDVGEIFYPHEYESFVINWDMYVELIPLGPPVRKYLTPEQIVAGLRGMRDDNPIFSDIMEFGATPDGRVYSEMPPTEGYKVMGWTPRMQKWIDENID